MMRDTEMPNGIGALGYGEGDISGLAEGAFAQQRLLSNSPVTVGRTDLEDLYRAAGRYW